MKKRELAEKAHLSNYTINKMNRGDNVTTDTLIKLCEVLNCTFDDIMEIVSNENKDWFYLDAWKYRNGEKLWQGLLNPKKK